MSISGSSPWTLAERSAGVPGGDGFWRRLRSRRRQPVSIATAVAALLCVVYLIAPPLGVDLSAQIARAGFAAQHSLSPVDFRWFGGTVTFGYSLWIAPLMAIIPPKVVGVVATVIGTWATTKLFIRAGARRPLAGGLAAALCQASSMMEGRVAFDLGLALGLCSLLLLGTGDRRRTAAAATLAFLAGGASPVAALLLWVAAGALVLHKRRVEAAVLLVASAIPVALVSGIFGEGGKQPFTLTSAMGSVAAMLLALLLVPARQELIRLGAAIGIVMVVGAFAISTPVGSNATRLPLLFALPVICAFAERGRRVIAAAIVMTIAVQAPVSASTVLQAGRPEAHRQYYSSVLNELRFLGPLSGRVEVPESAGHWESAYVASEVPLARGWLRQVDVKLNKDTFYKDKPTAASYLAFLRKNAVQYVAINDADLTITGENERRLVLSGLPYLGMIWHDPHWKLYRLGTDVNGIDEAVPVVSDPGVILNYTSASIQLRAPANSSVELAVRWFRWLNLKSTDDPMACIANVDGDAVLHTGPTGGTYTIGSSLPTGSGHC
ncbi:MAG: hypothetical protein ACR2F6_07065 [Mycobacteriales bacterium]